MSDVSSEDISSISFPYGRYSWENVPISGVGSEGISSISDRSTVDRDLEAFSDLLKLAEEVHACRESIRRQNFLAMSVSFAIIYGAVGAMAIFAYYIYAGDYQSVRDFWSTPMVLYLLFAILLLAYFGFAFLFIRYQKQMKRETQVLKNVMSVVHEVLQSSEKNMSPLEIAQVMIRLSRLDN